MWQKEAKKKVTGERGRWATRKLPAYTCMMYSPFNRGFYKAQITCTSHERYFSFILAMTVKQEMHVAPF